jgi:hypothetical protein
MSLDRQDESNQADADVVCRAKTCEKKHDLIASMAKRFYSQNMAQSVYNDWDS